MDEKKVAEEWRPLELDPTVQLSSKGRVKRHKRISHLNYRDKDGYKRLTVKGKNYMLHRLIAETFIPNPDNLPVVDHINNIHDDNRIENLRWTDVAGNTQYAAEMGLQTRLKNSKAVTVLIDQDNKGYMFTTNADCCREFGLDSARLSMAINGKAKTINGYRAIRFDELIDKRRVFDD